MLEERCDPFYDPIEIGNQRSNGRRKKRLRGRKLPLKSMLPSLLGGALLGIVFRHIPLELGVLMVAAVLLIYLALLLLPV